MPDLLQALEDYLVAQGIGRVPRVAGAAPAIWTEPVDGVPMPGKSPSGNAVEASDPVIGLLFSGGVPPKRIEVSLRVDTVDVWIRAKHTAQAFAVERQLRRALIGNQPGDMLAWDMAGLTILESRMIRPMQPLEHADGVFTYVCEFAFETNA